MSWKKNTSSTRNVAIDWEVTLKEAKNFRDRPTTARQKKKKNQERRMGTKERGQHLKPLAVLAEDLDLVSTAHMVAQGCL